VAPAGGEGPGASAPATGPGARALSRPGATSAAEPKTMPGSVGQGPLGQPLQAAAGSGTGSGSGSGSLGGPPTEAWKDAAAELRVDPSDGGCYTREQFLACYGGLAEWEAAQPVGE
jgi:hypothetical protein